MAVSSTFTAGSGEGYDRMMGRWSARLAEPFLDFAGCVDGEDVLDAGCGTGSLAFALARRAAARSITGIDYSSVYVEHAAARNSDAKIGFKTADICALPFADKSFDRVLSLLVLHFVPQTERATAELRRVARPGATVAAAVWDVRGGYVANRMFYAARERQRLRDAVCRAYLGGDPDGPRSYAAIAWAVAGVAPA